MICNPENQYAEYYTVYILHILHIYALPTLLMTLLTMQYCSILFAIHDIVHDSDSGLNITQNR